MSIWQDPYQALRWAGCLAGDLLLKTNVERVELFGSLARGEADVDSDIDLICIVPENVALDWLESCSFEETDRYHHSAAIRLQEASTLLDAPWLNEVAWGGGLLDIFLFPANWRSRLDELQTSGGHSDVRFMQKISIDATAYDPTTNSFPLAERLFRQDFYEDDDGLRPGMYVPALQDFWNNQTMEF